MKKMIAVMWSDYLKPYRWKIRPIKKNGAGSGGYMDWSNWLS